MCFSFNLACSFTRALTLLTSSGLVGSEDHYSKKETAGLLFLHLASCVYFHNPFFSPYTQIRLAVKVVLCFASSELLSHGLMLERRRSEKEKEGEVCNHLIQTYTHRILLHLATVIVFAISTAPKPIPFCLDAGQISAWLLKSDVFVLSITLYERLKVLMLSQQGK